LKGNTLDLSLFDVGKHFFLTIAKQTQLFGKTLFVFEKTWLRFTSVQTFYNNKNSAGIDTVMKIAS
jgi:hypothetical protein